MAAKAAPRRRPPARAKVLAAPAASNPDRRLAIAIGVSLAIHAILLSVHFTFPNAFKFQRAPALEIVLVNAKSERKPDKPQVMAQANLDGGGTVDDDRRAKTPMPSLPRNQPGADEVQRARARVQQLERQQQDMLTQIKQQEQAIAPVQPQPTPPQPEPPAPVPDLSGQDLANRALAMAKLEAQIARQVDDYNKRPKVTQANLRARETPFAMYVDSWRQKVERVGNANYPGDARGRVYGRLQLTVRIRPDGRIESVEVDRPSGYPVLDRAAERIVRLAAPYPPFPPDIRRDTDILEITRTWIFAPGDKLESE